VLAHVVVVLPCCNSAIHDVLIQQETRLLLKLFALASLSLGYVKAAPAQALKKHGAGLLGTFQARLRQIGPSILSSHVMFSWLNNSILQLVIATPLEEQVISTIYPSI
jgi:hypothetical protein